MRGRKQGQNCKLARVPFQGPGGGGFNMGGAGSNGQSKEYDVGQGDWEANNAQGADA